MKLDKITVAKRYGKALFELAVESQQAEDVYNELLKVRQIFEDIPQLGDLLSDVRLDLNEKRNVMDNLVKGFDGIVRNALEVIYQYNRMYDILLIIDEYERRFNDRNNLVLGSVTTAVPLTKEQKAKLTQKVANQLGYQKAELTEKVDPNILGGVIVEANHHVIDGSIRSRLEYLRKELRK
ncbi:F0F1 ATP synthase subunit delta [Enterococcus saccharolyticus]|uniref:ATP synthase subunit delta n=1 Tax=Enterococcus saccharolyticus subsp. saccharolyticus ATCC 43076 TaxID=1139996 RepID=S0NWP4_9ENTE|nr:F0F1 ATP synthase subunit delta [Enterococcus saccharolyticus]EOT30080.1 ATP synthase F1, delta subunit [Enterococcus saccharolyticus subsp. saccharolyticus ATCC 43076]EOT80626.1 ATP synthase F1, delta subunit [Enterococcus saccharolyticus subsp. saccharolyticus ATCC 43076]